MSDSAVYLRPKEACERFGVKRAMLMRIAETCGAIRRVTPRLYLINVEILQAFIENGGQIEPFTRVKR